MAPRSLESSKSLLPRQILSINPRLEMWKLGMFLQSRLRTTGCWGISGVVCSSEPLRRKPELLSLLMALTTYSSHLRDYSCRKDYYTSQFVLVPFLTMKLLTGFPFLLSPSDNGNASSTLPKVGVCLIMVTIPQALLYCQARPLPIKVAHCLNLPPFSLATANPLTYQKPE